MNTARRRLLGSAAVAALSAITGRQARAERQMRRRVADALFTDATTARAIGHACTAAPPLETRWLEQASALPDAASIRAFIAARVRADFASGDVLCVDGWMLARTEAQLCRMAAL